MKIVFQTALNHSTPDLSFLIPTSTETLNVEVGRPNPKSGKRTFKKFTGLIVKSQESFARIYPKIRDAFKDLNVVAFLEHEGYQYALNSATTKMTEKNRMVVAARGALSKLHEETTTVAVVEVSEVTVSYDTPKSVVERLRQTYPNMEIKVIDPVSRTITFSLGAPNVPVRAEKKAALRIAA